MIGAGQLRLSDAGSGRVVRVEVVPDWLHDRHETVLLPDGSFGWIGWEPNLSSSRQVVELARPGGRRMELDAAAVTDRFAPPALTALTTDGTSLHWQHDGEPRSAPL
jgi:hypothetical protein